MADLGDIRIKLLQTDRADNGRMALKIMNHVQCDCCVYEGLTPEDKAQSSIAFVHNQRIYQVDTRPCPLEDVHLSARYLVSIAKKCVPTLDTFLFAGKTTDTIGLGMGFELEDNVLEEIRTKVGDLAAIPAFDGPIVDKGVARLSRTLLLAPVYH